MFNIVNDKADPNILYLFEVYKDDKAVEAHKKMPHFVKLAGNYEGLACGAPRDYAKHYDISPR